MNCSISVATVEFILHISAYFRISYVFLGMLHKTTFFVIFFFTFILNWKVPTFLCVFWLNTLPIVSSTLQKTFSEMLGKSGRKYFLCKAE
jgi:hypothetical protein